MGISCLIKGANPDQLVVIITLERRKVMSRSNNIKAGQLLAIGFILLMIGIGLATLSGSSRALQIIGLLFIVVASAVFGASVAKQNKNS